LKTLIYFEVVSTVALAIGLLVGEFLHPGAGFNIDPSTLDPKDVASFATRAKQESLVGHLLAIIPPDSYFGALARGDLLQILLISILSGFAISQLGAVGEKISSAIDTAAKMFFGSSASSCAPPRSVRSARWPSPSASTASARWSISGR